MLIKPRAGRNRIVLVSRTQQAVTDLDLGGALDGLFEGACHLDALSGLVEDVRRSQGRQCAIREDVVRRQDVEKVRRLVGCEIVGRWSRLG